MTQRQDADQDLPDQDVPDQDVPDQDVTDQDVTDQDLADQPSGDDAPAPVVPPAPPLLRGNLDMVRADGTIIAWCWCAAEPTVRREVTVMVDGVEVARGHCDQSRPDLVAAAVGDGGHSLTLVLPAAARPAERTAIVTLRDVATGQAIGKPTTITWRAGPPATGPQAAGPPPAESPTTEPTQPVPSASARPGPLNGNVDRVTRDGWVLGWCWRPDRPEDRISVTVLVDDEPIGTTRASAFRSDLEEAGVGDGAHGFAMALPWSVMAEKGRLRVSVQETGTGLPLGDPVLMRAGRLAAAEERIQELERQIHLLQAHVQEVNRHAQGRDDDRAARALFATAADFFQALAHGDAGAVLGGGLKGAVDDLTERLAPLVLTIPVQPSATICVTACATVETLHACLLALHEAGVDAAADIVLIDDGAVAGDAALLPAVVRNLRYVRVPAGGTLVAARNEVAQAARGDLIAFLAPQVRVLPGWLDELAATFAREPAAAAVGAKVVRSDGLVHHTGILLHADGQLDDPAWLTVADDPEYDFLRPMHGVGDIAFAVRRDRLLGVGGFSGAYVALPHAVFDLCMRLRLRGDAVLYQPAARVTWSDDGIADDSPVPDLTLQDEDSRLLRQRWQSFAQTTGPDAGGLTGPAFIGHALVIDTAIPRPDRDAGSVTTLAQMHLLRKLGYRVTFAAAGGDVASIVEAAVLRRQGIEVAMPPHYRSATAYLETHGATLDLVQVYRHMNASVFLDRVRDLAPQAKFVFSPADLHYLREARGAEVQGRATQEATGTREQELDCIRRSDATILFSDFERDLLKDEVDQAKLWLLRWITHPNPSGRGFADRSGLCFVGGFQHDPNADGVLWFVTEILPLVRAQVPGLQLHVVGSDMPDRILALASASVAIHGWVPDLATIFGQVRLSVAPLRYGAGFKGKVATSLSYGVPVVGTAIALEGTGLADGDGIAIADDPAAFARAVVRLHEDEAAWTASAAAGLARCRALYSPEAALAVYRRLLGDLGLPLPPD
jgi:glycosyltransferase involved in cell wall biosynthesis/GT2 family glycosyltransferase